MANQDLSGVPVPEKQNAVRVAYIVSHPIQYQAPLLRLLAAEPDIDLTVFFGSDFSLKSYKDAGFGVKVEWDVPLLGGFKHQFLAVTPDEGVKGSEQPTKPSLRARLKSTEGKPFDVVWVHGYSSKLAVRAILAAKSLRIPVLVRAEPWLRDRIRSFLKLKGKQLYFKALAKLVDGVMPIGTLNAQYWTHYFGTSVPQFLVPYAVDNSYFQQRSLAAQGRLSELQAELGLDPSRPVILFASKLQNRKHCDHLLSAYLRLSVDGAEPHPYLVIVGDGEQRALLEAQAAASGFKSIRFCGFRNQSELPAFFTLATVFVLPSRHEAWGLIVNEVMNAGRAIILTDDIGCQPDLIEDGVQGCVYPVGDIDALTAALHRVLDEPGVAAQMGRRALERINQWSFKEDIAGLRRAIAHVTGKIHP